MIGVWKLPVWSRDGPTDQIRCYATQTLVKIKGGAEKVRESKKKVT